MTTAQRRLFAEALDEHGCGSVLNFIGQCIFDMAEKAHAQEDDEKGRILSRLSHSVDQAAMEAYKESV